MTISKELQENIEKFEENYNSKNPLVDSGVTNSLLSLIEGEMKNVDSLEIKDLAKLKNILVYLKLSEQTKQEHDKSQAPTKVSAVRGILASARDVLPKAIQAQVPNPIQRKREEGHKNKIEEIETLLTKIDETKPVSRVQQKASIENLDREASGEMRAAGMEEVLKKKPGPGSH